MEFRAKPPTAIDRLSRWARRHHSRSDPGHYRASEEVAAWKERDPIALYEARLCAEGVLDREKISAIASEIENQLEKAVELAEQAPSPGPEDCLTDVFAN